MIFIGLGSNLPSRFGTPAETLKLALQKFKTLNLRVVQTSSIWRTAPVPVSDQPWYKNAVACIETDLNPKDLLKALKTLERDFGRREGDRNAARVLDLDILDYKGLISQSDHLILPHPRLHERGFVLYPLQEIAPYWVHPTLKLSIDYLIGQLSVDQTVEISADQAA